MKTDKLDWEDLLPKIKKLLEEGKTYTEISELLNISFTSAKEGAKKLGLTYKTKHNFWSPEEIDQLRKYLNEKKSYKEISKLFPNHTMLSIAGIIRYGGKKLNLKYQGNKRRYLKDTDIEKVKRLNSMGFNYKEIADKLSVGPSSISNAMKNIGEKPLGDNEKRAMGWIRGIGFTGLTKEVLTNLLVDKKLSYKAIAKKYGLYSSTVSRCAKSLGIEKPQEEKINVEIHKTHRAELLEKFLGHEPNKEEKKLRLDQVIPKETIENAYKLNNYNTKLGANYLGISQYVFNKLINKFNISRPATPKISDHPESFYKKLFVDEGKSYADIAEIVHLSVDTVRKYLCKTFPDYKHKKHGRYQSVGEKLVAESLKSMNIEFIYNKRYPNINPEDPDRIYIIDFSFSYKGKEFWIEYNGEQHYKYIEYFYKNRDKFEKQVKRDEFINNLSNQLSIPLLIIPYTVLTGKKISELILDFLSRYS